MFTGKSWNSGESLAGPRTQAKLGQSRGQTVSYGKYTLAKRRQAVTACPTLIGKVIGTIKGSLLFMGVYTAGIETAGGIIEPIYNGLISNACAVASWWVSSHCLCVEPHFRELTRFLTKNLHSWYILRGGIIIEHG